MSEPTPEELELEKKKIEYENLTINLAQKELDLATLIGEMQSFESLYVKIVGVRLVELDDIEAQIQERLVSNHPHDINAQFKAETARENAQASSQAFQQSDKETESIEKFKPTENLKNLYREVAKLIHPDLEQDEKARIYREELMKQANQAFQMGDEDKLNSILREWQTSPETIIGEGVAEDLVRIIRLISRIGRRIQLIEEEYSKILNSEICRLMNDIADAENSERDLLSEMAEELDTRIAQKRKILIGLLNNTISS